MKLNYPYYSSWIQFVWLVFLLIERMVSAKLVLACMHLITWRLSPSERSSSCSTAWIAYCLHRGETSSRLLSEAAGACVEGTETPFSGSPVAKDSVRQPIASIMPSTFDFQWPFLDCFFDVVGFILAASGACVKGQRVGEDNAVVEEWGTVEEDITGMVGDEISAGSIGIMGSWLESLESKLLKSDGSESLNVQEPGLTTPLPMVYVPSMRSAIQLKSRNTVFCHLLSSECTEIEILY